MLDVGLRSGYVASYYAAPLMVEQTARPGDLHLRLGRGPLCLRARLRRAQGGHGQVRRRHGGRLQGL